MHTLKATWFHGEMGGVLAGTCGPATGGFILHMECHGASNVQVWFALLLGHKPALGLALTPHEGISNQCCQHSMPVSPQEHGPACAASAWRPSHL